MDLHVPSSQDEHSDISRAPSIKGSKIGRRAKLERSGVTKDVALKVIAKKKVKGNEASIWEEMAVLEGLNHPNIVRDSQSIHHSLPLSGTASSQDISRHFLRFFMIESYDHGQIGPID